MTWIEINERVRYAYDEENGVFILQHGRDGMFRTIKKFRYEDLKKIWDALPERATTDDIREVAKRLGIQTSLENYLMRIFTHVKFGGDLSTQNGRLVLIKSPDDCYL